MTTAPHLPPIQEDRTLERLLPAHLDYREFRRVPHAPDRYAACLLGRGVWDLYRKCFSDPQPDKNGRRRFHINPGPNAKAGLVYYNVILALIVLGPPSHPKAQAHHTNEVPTDDRWDNVFWQTPEQNRARAAEHQAQKRRMGEDNGRTALTDAKLAEFIRMHDDDQRRNRRIPWDLYANPFFFNVSERQLRRIAKGAARGERVAEIRRQIAAERKSGQLTI